MSINNETQTCVVYSISYLTGTQERVTVLKAVHEESKLFVSVDGKPKSYNLRNLNFADGSIQKGDKFIVNVSKAEYTEQSQTDRNGNPIYNVKSGYTIHKDTQYQKPVIKKGMVGMLKEEAKAIKATKATKATKTVNKIVKVQIG
jgi:hypothetical protein